MSGAAPNNSNAPRRPWVEPTLTRHQSLTALTQQDYGPYPMGYSSSGYPIGAFADTIPGSVTVFPSAP